MKKLTFVFLCFCFLASSGVFAANEQNSGRIIKNYDTPLTEQDKQNINYIINTLSSKSMFGLLGVKKKLEAVGKETNTINPLTHLQYIFSNSGLKAKTKNIGKVPWNRFVKDFGVTFNLALQENKINDQTLREFAQKVNVSYDVLKPLYDKRDWSKFINTLRDS